MSKCIGFKEPFCFLLQKMGAVFHEIQITSQDDYQVRYEFKISAFILHTVVTK